MITPSGFVPSSGAITAFTRCTRRSPFVNVPLFSRNDDAGSTTSANSAVGVMNNSCTTRNSSAFSAAFTYSVLGSVCATSSPMIHIAFSFPPSAASYICGIFQPI